MKGPVRVHKIASVVYRLGLGKDVEITEDLEAVAGNAIVVRALSEKRVYSELELENGRLSKIFRGDLIVGALGRRRAPRGFAGEVPAAVAVGERLTLLNMGGVIGTRATAHKDLGSPVACEVLGMALRGGGIANIADERIPPVDSLENLRLPPVVMVSGTSMSTGKTLLLCELVQELSKSGVKIAGGKLTGVACLRDQLAMLDHGAVASVSFLEAGVPSTAGLGQTELCALARSVIAYLAAAGPDLIALELGDGIIGEYGAMDILKDPQIAASTQMHVFCAGDLVGSWGGYRLLKESGIEIDLFSGPVTDNRVGVSYLEKQFNRPAINAYRNPEELAARVCRHLGIKWQRQ